eukprot:1575853-Rhodomonas_salina.2
MSKICILKRSLMIINGRPSEMADHSVSDPSHLPRQTDRQKDRQTDRRTDTPWAVSVPHQSRARADGACLRESSVTLSDVTKKARWMKGVG